MCLRFSILPVEKLSSTKFNGMKRKIVIDCRRILVGKKLDVDYFAIGVGKKN